MTLTPIGLLDRCQSGPASLWHWFMGVLKGRVEADDPTRRLKLEHGGPSVNSLEEQRLQEKDRPPYHYGQTNPHRN